MTIGALIGGIVGGVVGLAVVTGSAWAAYRVRERRRTRGTASLATLKVDVEAPTIRTLVPVPMPGASYQSPVPILVAAHTGWGLRPPPRPKARRMLRSPARRASENALPTLLELRESEFGDSEGPEPDDRLDKDGVGALGFSLGCWEAEGTDARTDIELAPPALGAPPETHPSSTSSSGEHESEAAAGEETRTSATSDDGSAIHASSRTKSTPDLCPPETPSSLGSFPVTPKTPGGFVPDEVGLDLGRDTLDSASSDSEESTPTSTPEGTLERPKRRECVKLDHRRSLGAFIRGHYV